MMLGPAYPVGAWARDKRVHKEYRVRFLLWATKSPYIDPFLETSEDDSYSRSEHRCSGRICEGLAVAKIIGGLGVSFHSADEWNVSEIVLSVFEIGQDGSGSLDYNCTVNHAASTTHAQEHAKWIGRRRMQAVVDGKDCCDRLAELFPQVNLCSNAVRQLSCLGKGEDLFQTAYAALEDLSRYASGWKQGGFRNENLAPCSEESNSTLEQFGDERKFGCPDGKPRTFSWHLKRGRWRIHFIPDDGNRTLLVGYLGKHLRTARFR